MSHDDAPTAPPSPPPGRSTTWAAHRARLAAEALAAAERQHHARRSALTSAALVLVLVLLGTGGWVVSRMPGSPVRDWVERHPTDVTAVSFVDPARLPSTFTPGDRVRVQVQVRRTTAPGAPQSSEHLRWTVSWEPAQGPAVPLQDGSTDVAPGGTQTLDITAAPPGKTSGRLLVSFDSGQWLAMRLEAADG